MCHRRKKHTHNENFENIQAGSLVAMVAASLTAHESNWRFVCLLQIRPIAAFFIDSNWGVARTAPAEQNTSKSLINRSCVSTAHHKERRGEQGEPTAKPLLRLNNKCATDTHVNSWFSVLQLGWSTWFSGRDFLQKAGPLLNLNNRYAAFPQFSTDFPRR